MTRWVGLDARGLPLSHADAATAERAHSVLAHLWGSRLARVQGAMDYALQQEALRCEFEGAASPDTDPEC